MLFDETSAQHLKPWLLRTLEPICDAEPGALADYILALLKHNVSESEMRNELATQLDEFLEKECSPFVDTLFNILRTKSYLPYAEGSSSSSKPDSGIPIPLHAMVASSSSSSPPTRSRKRNLDHDEIDGRPPVKGPRLSTEGQFSRYGGRSNVSTGGWNGLPVNNSADMGSATGGGVGIYQPPQLPRGLCRDYHNNGCCMRGNTCKYSHGQDVIRPDPYMFPMNPHTLPFLPMFDNSYAVDGGAYDPHQSRMDMTHYYPQGPQPQNRGPSVLPRSQIEDSSRPGRISKPSGELPVIQDLTPASDERPHPHLRTDNPNPQNDTTTESKDHPDARAAPMDVDSTLDQRPPQNVSHRGGFRPRPDRPRKAPGTFNSDVSSLRPEKRKGLTLVVEKIPREKLSLEDVNAWFKRFGTVTNVAIDPAQGKALVSFATNEEAHVAWKCEDAVFSNRFVKVFWHRPMEGHGQKGAKMLAASANTIAHLSEKEGPSQDVTMDPTPPPPSAPLTHTSLITNSLAAKQQLLEKQIAEQKSLMGSLQKASAEEKKEVMARLRKLGEEMKSEPILAPISPSPQGQREQKLRERLDKELEFAAAKTDEPPTKEDTTSLKDQLEKLKAEAASLGLSQNGGAEPWQGPYRGRARGRGRGYSRGFARGGFARGNQKLDNRPKKLLIEGVSSNDLQPLHDWYESTGQVDTVNRLENGSVVVAFQSRGSAEQGLAKGNKIPAFGSAQISWYTGTSPSTPAPAVPLPQPAPTPVPVPVVGPPEQPARDEEELVSSGWGDGEEGVGMI